MARWEGSETLRGDEDEEGDLDASWCRVIGPAWVMVVGVPVAV